jgi:hypothetical protein
LATINNSDFSSIKILSDDIEKKPIIGFDALSSIITNIVKDSEPKFSIGIFGQWGTGKTTLMELVDEKIKKSSKEEEVFT